MFKNLLLSSVLLIAASCTGLVSLELLLRVTETPAARNLRIFQDLYYRGYPDDTFFFQYHPELGWTCTPDKIIRYSKNEWSAVFQTDAEGFRHLPDPAPADPRQPSRRVLLLGDSSGFGLGARDDETIDHFLLGQSRQLALRNLSSPGWSPEQYYAAYLKYAERFLPTHVYMLITHLNDFVIMESCTAFNRLKPTVAMDAKQQPVGLVRPGDMLRFQPVASDYVANLRLFYRAGRVLEPHYLRKLCGTNRPYGMLGNYDVDRLEIYSATEDAKGASDPIWKRFDFVVEEASRKAKQDHAVFGIVVLPLGPLSDQFQKEKDRLRHAAGDYSVDVVLNRVRAIGRRHEVDVLYPAAEFERRERAGESLASPEGHFSAIANGIVADTILAHVNQPARR